MSNSLGRKWLVFFILLAILIFDRALLLVNFSFDYVGGDDLIFWLATNDYARGIFHEPYFYGQDYNPMLEALLAVPLEWLGVGLRYALPISTSFISLFPFLLISFVLMRRGHFEAACCTLVFPLTLPVEYGLLCSMSRGFVQGLFFSGFLIFPLLNPNKKLMWAVAALVTSLGYIFNPNSLIAAFPVCLYLLLINYRRIGFYLISAASAVPAIALELAAKQFYKLHPTYNVHPFPTLVYSWSQWIESLQSLDNYYTYFMPFLWKAGWLILPTLFLAGVFLWKRNKAQSATIIVTVFFVLFSTGINKVNDSIHHLLLSSARMYLGLPLVSCFVFFWLFSATTLNSVKSFAVILAIAILTLLTRTSISDQVIARYTGDPDKGCVAIKNIDTLQCNCNKIKSIAQNHAADLVVFVPSGFRNTGELIFYTYACPLLDTNMPPTLLAYDDRRGWIFLNGKKLVRKRILFSGLYIPDSQVLASLKSYKFIYDEPLTALFYDNTLTLDSLFKRMGLRYPR